MLSLDFNNELVKAAPIVGTGVADGAARLFFGLSLNGAEKITDDVYKEVMEMFPENEWEITDTEINRRGLGITTYEIEMRRACR